jgi:hypothetical protein
VGRGGSGNRRWTRVAVRLAGAVTGSGGGDASLATREYAELADPVVLDGPTVMGGGLDEARTSGGR